MWAYVVRRLIYMIPILFGVALLTFCLFSLFGEDPVLVALGQHASKSAVLELQHKWGLDLPLWQQFFNFLYQVITFDYGYSFSSGESLTDIFSEGALVSLSLTAPPFMIGLVLNLIIAMIIAHYRGSLLDKYSRVLFIVAMSISYLVYIIVCQYFFAYKYELFPIQGYEEGLESINYLVLPWIIIMLVSMGPDIRVYRTIFLDESGADYIRTAKAKGVDNSRLLFVHLFKNAMIPVLTNTVVAIPFLITGAFVMERYFGIPGIGDITITAINEGDFPIIKAMTMLIALLYSIFNLLTDLTYALVDPRVKLS